jgi:hypothetical protein
MKPALRSYSEPSVVAGDAMLRFAHFIGAEMEFDFSAYVVGSSAFARETPLPRMRSWLRVRPRASKRTCCAKYHPPNERSGEEGEGEGEGDRG